MSEALQPSQCGESCAQSLRMSQSMMSNMIVQQHEVFLVNLHSLCLQAGSLNTYTAPPPVVL